MKQNQIKVKNQQILDINDCLLFINRYKKFISNPKMYESTNTKLLQQKLRTIVSFITEKQANRLLDKFIQFTNQKIESNTKQISYKCYEAVITMKSTKTTAYGRSEADALTSAIRNFFQNLLDDEKYLYVIKQAVKKNIEYSQHQHTDDNKENNNMAKLQIQINKKTSIKKPPIHNNLMNNFNYLNMSLTDQISNSKSKSKIFIDNLNISGVKNGENNLNKSQDKDFGSNTIDDQLKRAKQYIKQLQAKLKIITDQNKMMKNQLQTQDITASKNSQTVNNNKEFLSNNEKIRSTSYDYQNKTTLFNTSQHNHSILDNNFLNNSTIEEKKKNNKVPRLKLQILPNYHGKSNKCLNQVLLAAYQQKQAATKKY